jgi:hypothetical protein
MSARMQHEPTSSEQNKKGCDEDNPQAPFHTSSLNPASHEDSVFANELTF